MKKIPQRMCIVTREKTDKKDLLRIVKTPEGEVLVDISGKLNGKGAYITKSIEVVNMARKKKVFERTFEMEDLSSLYDEIENTIK